MNEVHNNKKNMAGRWYILGLLCILILACITGCGKKKKNYLGDTRNNTFTINEDGSILEIACQDFSGVSYDISNLKSNIEDEIKSYRSARSEDSKNTTVKLLQYEEKDGFVRIAMQYADLASYNSFNNTNYRDESVAILPTDLIFKDMSGNDVALSDITGNNYKVFLTDGDYELTVNGTVLYYNEHVTTIGSNGSVYTDGEGTAAVIYQ